MEREGEDKRQNIVVNIFQKAAVIIYIPKENYEFYYI